PKPAAPTAAQKSVASSATQETPRIPAEAKKISGFASSLPQNVPTISFTDAKLLTTDFRNAKEMLIENMLEQVNFEALEKMSKEIRKSRVGEMADTLMNQINIPLTSAQRALLKDDMLNEVLGLGPLELLMSDPDVSDIMINTHKQVYIEKAGKILLSDI